MAMFLLPIGEEKARLVSGRAGVLFSFWVWWIFMGLFGSCCVLVGLGFFAVFMFFVFSSFLSRSLVYFLCTRVVPLYSF
jgi:hypothetical protein